MGERTIRECDNCGTAATDDTDLSTWRRATLAVDSLFPAAPQALAAGPDDPSLVSMGAGMSLPSPPRMATAMLCPKQACLTKWLKDEGAKKVEPESA